METLNSVFVQSGKSKFSASNKFQSTKLFLKRNKQAFLQKYDEVVSKHILSIFHRTPEEYERAHDHRVTKVIKGELVNLRLDSLNGEADGIKVSSLRKEIPPLYIWFQPDLIKRKITFKTVCGEKRKKIQVDLHNIGSDYVTRLIARLFIKQLSVLSI